MNKEIMLSPKDDRDYETTGVIRKILPFTKNEFGLYRKETFIGVSQKYTEPLELKINGVERIEKDNGSFDYEVTFISKKQWDMIEEERITNELISRFLKRSEQTLGDYREGVKDVCQKFEYELSSFASAITHKCGKLTVRISNHSFCVYLKCVATGNEYEKVLETPSIERAIVKYERLQLL